MITGVSFGEAGTWAARGSWTETTQGDLRKNWVYLGEGHDANGATVQLWERLGRRVIVDAYSIIGPLYKEAERVNG